MKLAGLENRLLINLKLFRLWGGHFQLLLPQGGYQACGRSVEDRDGEGATCFGTKSSGLLSWNRFWCFEKGQIHVRCHIRGCRRMKDEGQPLVAAFSQHHTIALLVFEGTGAPNASNFLGQMPFSSFKRHGPKQCIILQGRQTPQQNPASFLHLIPEGITNDVCLQRRGGSVQPNVYLV